MTTLDWTTIKNSNPDWTNCSIFLENGNILVSSINIDQNLISQWLELFKDYDFTIKEGFYYNDIHYHVHRFYDGLIYGRADPVTERTDGFCFLKFLRENKEPLILIFTFDLPALTARVIPAANKYLDTIKDQLP